jgi:hypothetical protein
VVVTSTEKTTPSATGTISLTIKLLPHLTVTSSASGLTGTSPNWSGTAGSGSTVTVSTSGGTAYTYAAQSTPTGITFAGTTLTIGTSVVAGQYNVTIMSTDTASGATAQIVLNITLLPQLTVTAASTDMSGSGTSFSGSFASNPLHLTVSTSGGTSYQYTMSAQSGFSLDKDTGILTITAASQVSAYTVVITSTDTSGATANINLSITVND